MKKTVVTVATVTIVGFSSTFLIDSASAESIQDLQNRQVQLQDERSVIKEDLEDAKEEIALIMIDLDELGKEIAQTDKALKENNKTIVNTNKEINVMEEEINELEASIENRQEILNDRMVSYQRNGGNIGFLDVIFGSKSFSDLISRITAVNKITLSDTELMDLLDQDKGKVEVKLTELEEMKADLEEIQKIIAMQQEENDQKKETLESKEEELEDKIDSLNLKDSELASIESQVSEQIAEKRQEQLASSIVNNSNNSGSSSDNLTTVSKSQPVAGSGSISTIINAGYPYLGTPYVWAGKGPGGFDCSGFVSWAYSKAGYSIPSSTAGLQSIGTKVSYSNIQPGDLVFFNTYKVNGHVGIYIGNGKFIGAQTSTGLAIADMTSGYWKNHFAGHVRRVAK